MSLPLASVTATTVIVLMLAGCGEPAGTGGTAGSGSGSGSGGSGTSGVGGTAGSTGTAGSVPPTFATVKLVLQGGGPVMPCAAAPCHGVNGMAPPTAPLELPPNDDPKLYTNLTSYVSKACGNLKLVDAGNASASALPKILTGPCGVTPRMPYGCSDQDGNCIPPEYVAAITQWIASGAPQE